MNEKTYPSDLTDEEWEWIKELIPAAKSGGRPRTLCMRAVLNAIFYVTKGGIQWRMLPTNFPKWQSVYHDLRTWKLQGVWVRIHDTLRLSDQAGARKIFKRMRGTGKKLRKVWVDGTYRGAEWTSWVKEQYNIVLESVARAEGQKGFAVLPHRWVVERTLAWLNQSRRLSKDYEELPSTSETFVYVAMTRLMLKRLAA